MLIDVSNELERKLVEMYADITSRNIAPSVSHVVQLRDLPPAQIAQAWVLNHPGVDCVLAVGWKSTWIPSM